MQDSALQIIKFYFRIPEKTTGTGLAKLFPNQRFPEELYKMKKRKDNSNYKADFNQALAIAVNELNVSKNDIIAALTDDNVELNEGMDKVMKYLSKDHDIIIISGSQKEKIKVYLDKFGLLDIVQDIFAQPWTITDNGRILYTPIPTEWGGPCKITGQNICKASILKYFVREHGPYENLIYFGDGLNDLCPSLSLKEFDSVCPKKGSNLELLLKEKIQNVQAQIIPWNDGTDLLKYI